MNASEDKLCELFADLMKDSPEFAAWVLSQTKFAQSAKMATLLDEEQMSIRPRKLWWRHWWCNAPGLKKVGRETDIFMVFERTDTKARFAIHFENKRDNYKFNDGQAEDYNIRAAFMLGKDDYLNHRDFATVLLATTRFRKSYQSQADLFDHFISYESVAEFIPEYTVS